MIYLFGYRGFVFIIFGAFRPAVLKMEKIINIDEIPWRRNYYILLYSVIIFSCLIILFYLIDIFFLTAYFINVNEEKIFLSSMPIFFLLHGIMGLIYLYVNREDR